MRGNDTLASVPLLRTRMVPVMGRYFDSQQCFNREKD
jgi:hypothetical protein